MKRVGLSAVFAAAILCLSMGAAWAHGDVVKTDPKKNARVALPEVVSVTLEPTESTDDVTSNAAGDDSTTNTSGSADSSFPVIPVVTGGVALVAVAAAVRAKSAR